MNKCIFMLPLSLVTMTEDVVEQYIAGVSRSLLKLTRRLVLPCVHFYVQNICKVQAETISKRSKLFITEPKALVMLNH